MFVGDVFTDEVLEWILLAGLSGLTVPLAFDGGLWRVDMVIRY